VLLKETLVLYTDYLYAQGYNDPLPSGVYALVDVRTSKAYIGSTKNFTNRSGQHFRALEEGIHHNRQLQLLFETSGPSSFSFVVLERIPDLSQLEAREQTWLNRLKKIALNRQWVIDRTDEWETVAPIDRVVFPWEKELDEE
jgi:predicted GIY-YIG superfamily endonuclease